MQAYGFHIEGIGDDLSAGNRGTMFYSSEKPPAFFTPGTGEDTDKFSWSKTLASEPSPSTTSVVPPKGEATLAAWQPHLSLTDTVSQLLNARQTQVQFRLQEDITSSDTTIKLGEGEGADAGLFGSLPADIYIGEETIRVHTDKDGGEYGVERGFWDSAALSHAGSTDRTEPRAGVYTRPPYYDKRLIWFVVVDNNLNIYQRTFSYWNGKPDIKQNTSLKIFTTESFQMMRDSEVYDASKTWEIVHDGTSTVFTLPSGSTGRQQPIDGRSIFEKGRHFLDFPSQIAKQKDASGNTFNGKGGWYTDPDDDGRVLPDIGKYEDYPMLANSTEQKWSNLVLHVKVQGRESSAKSDVPEELRGGENDEGLLLNGLFTPPRGFLEEYKDSVWTYIETEAFTSTGSKTQQRASVQEYAKAWEVAHWDPNPNIAPYPLEDAEQKFPNISPNSSVASIVSTGYHPLCIASALLFSKDTDQINPSEYDFLNSNISLQADFLFGDKGKQSFLDAYNEKPDQRVDKFTVGFGGGPVNTFNKILHLLVSNGFFLAPANDGTLRVRTFEPLDAKEAVTVSTSSIEPVINMEGEANWNWSGDAAFGTHFVGGPVGKTPLAEGTQEWAYALEASPRIVKMQEPEQKEYEFPHIAEERSWAARGFLQKRAQILHARIPTVRLQAPPPEKISDINYDLGTWLKIDNPPNAEPPLFFEKDGTTIDPANAEKEYRFYGLITHRQWSPKSNSYILECALLNFDAPIGRDRAPCGEVESVNANGDRITLKNNTFSTGAEDAQSFEVGQELMLLDDTLKERDAISAPEITNIGSDFLDLDASPAFSSTPQAGDFVTLAPYERYSLANSLSLIEYAYLADSNDKLGASSLDDAHHWQ